MGGSLFLYNRATSKRDLERSHVFTAHAGAEVDQSVGINRQMFDVLGEGGDWTLRAIGERHCGDLPTLRTQDAIDQIAAIRCDGDSISSHESPLIAVA